MKNLNLPAQAKTLEKMADRLENEARTLRTTAETLRSAGAVVGPLLHAVQIATQTPDGA